MIFSCCSFFDIGTYRLLIVCSHGRDRVNGGSPFHRDTHLGSDGYFDLRDGRRALGYIALRDRFWRV